MKHNSSKIPSQRQLKVGEELRHTLSEVFMRGDFYDPETREEICVTVSEVRVSPDLANATVFVMPLGGKNSERTMESLSILAPKVRSLISRKVQLRRIPSLHFKLDDTFNRAHDMNNLLNSPEVKADIERESSEEEI